MDESARIDEQGGRDKGLWVVRDAVKVAVTLESAILDRVGKDGHFE